MPAAGGVSPAASPWCSLPGDVFNTVLELLPPAHCCLLPQVCSAWRSLASALHSDVNYWRTLCLRRWGPSLLQLASPALLPHASAAHEAAAWRRYYIQRVAWFNLPTSPYHLIQEEQCGDPWRVMVACQVSSRTGASAAKLDVLAAVLAAFPSPSAMMAAPRHALAAMMDRVGMQEQRASALTRMSEGFLGEWQQPSQLFGIGPFGQESVYLFQRGAAAWPAFKTDDTNLSLYLSWARKDLRNLAGQLQAAEEQLQAAEEGGGRVEGARSHTPAQAQLMASVCPPDVKRGAKRCSSALADVRHTPAAAAAHKRHAAAGGGSQQPSARQPAERPRRAVRGATQAQQTPACGRSASIPKSHKKS